jgi:diacylglycerol kinase (ATP)
MENEQKTDSVIAETFGLQKISAIGRAFRFSIDGIASALKSERAIRQEAFLLACAVPLSFLVATDPFRRAMLIGSVILVVAIELLNSAVEKLCDHLAPERHPAIKDVKDMGSAAVLFTLIASAALWLTAAWERLS